MKQIKAYYTEQNKLYVQKEQFALNKEGIEIDLIDASTLPQKMLTPSFVVFKNGRFFSKLVGKQTPGNLLSWVKSYLKETK